MGQPVEPDECNGKPTYTFRPTSEKYSNVIIESRGMGAYRLFTAWDRPQPFNIKRHIRGLTQFKKGYMPTIRRVMMDTYRIAPGLSTMYFLSSLSSALVTAVRMTLSSRLYRLLEGVLVKKTGSRRDVMIALGLVIAWGLISSEISGYEWKFESQLRTRVVDHFHLKIMERDLKKDFATTQETSESEGHREANGEDVWKTVNTISSYFTRIASTVSQVLALARIASESGGFLLPLSFLISSAVRLFSAEMPWERVSLAYVSNPDYSRLLGLDEMMKTTYRQDVISGNLADWILSEYRRLKGRLAGISVEDPMWQVIEGSNYTQVILMEVLDNLPVILSVGYAMTYPEQYSLSALAISQSSASRMQYCLNGLTFNDEELRQDLTRLRNLYLSLDEMENRTEEGQINFPHEHSSSQGMGFELQGIEFSYPGSDDDKKSLKGIDLSIPPGSIVVLVGPNGSGKSTLIRLLSRLYNPTSGSILIDGNPTTSYTLSSLQQSSVILAQDQNIFPFSFADNIGLGCPSLLGDMDLIHDAAEKGGAREFINKYEAGFDTALDPFLSVQTNLLEDPEHPLELMKKKLKKKIDVSGGEKQRVVASRAFMRMNSNNIRFVAVDEPTSALDAEGELHLFTRLLEAREGKTMIFVTHRFGYLTRQADMIVCLKNGYVEEVGTHLELMAKPDGEYAKLYNIQASAFIEEPSRMGE